MLGRGPNRCFTYTFGCWIAWGRTRIYASRMKITFDVGGRPAEFRRNPFTGRSSFVVGGDEKVLASLSELSTHFDYATTKKWHVEHDGHEIDIQWQRSQLLGGLRPQTFTIGVDGQQVATARGM
jgi:hypothetical protein